MRHPILGAACAISIASAGIGAAYQPVLPDTGVPRAVLATPTTAAPTLVPTLHAMPGATNVPATPQPGMGCGNLDPGLWKRSLPPDGTALPTPQTLSDTMTLLPPGGTVPMPNACLPQQTPPPSSTPGLHNVAEPLSP